MRCLLITPPPCLIIIARYAIMGYMYFKSKQFDDKRGWRGKNLDTDAVNSQNQLHQVLWLIPYLMLLDPLMELDCVSMCLIFNRYVNEDSSPLEHIIQPPPALINGPLEEDLPSP